MSSTILKWYQQFGDLARILRREELNLFSAAFLAASHPSLIEASEEKVQYVQRTIEHLALASRDQAQDACKKAGESLQKIRNAHKIARYKTIYAEAELLDRGLFGASEMWGHPLFEVGMNFDPYLNVPFIPASSTKGAVKACWEKLYPDDMAECNALFGTPTRKGLFTLCDAFPVSPGINGYLLYPDVLTPHYSKQGEDILRETEAEPVPVPHLTVAPKTAFGFVIAFKNDMDKATFDKFHRSLLLAMGFGVGARTSVGYGVFKLRKFDAEVPLWK